MTASAPDHRQGIRAEIERCIFRQWSIFPVHEWTGTNCACQSDCGSPGKHPKLKPGYLPSSDAPVILKWWKKWPNANIGLYPGRSRLCVLDIDPRNAGDESLAALEKQIGELPETVQACTGGGGWHYYFLRPLDREDVPSRVIAPGLEFKGDQGYVILPPSMHYSGKKYAWESGHHPDETEIAKLPPALLELVGSSRTQPVPSDPRGPIAGLIGAAFSAAGMMGRALGRDRAEVICPWQHEHTSGKEHDTSTIVFAPSMGRTLGWFHCSHSHCYKMRSAQDVLDALPAKAVEAAKALVGVAEEYTPPAPENRPQRPEVLADDWKKALSFNSKLQLISETGNAALILANHPAWKGCLAFDKFTGRQFWTRRSPPPLTGFTPPEPGADVRDTDAVYVGHWFSIERGMKRLGKTIVFDAMARAATENSVDSLADWLRSLKWDGLPRIDTWLERYLGAKDTEVNRFVGSSWLVSGVARGLDPGCQVDHMLVLEGPQGNGKTSALEALAGRDWILRQIGSLQDKDSRQALLGKWIVNFEELSALRRSEWEAVKQFLTDRADTYRAAYARTAETHKRRSICAGTTNPLPGQGYLTDPTGKRRFWPVLCTTIDLAGLRDAREQLWAEARDRYLAGKAYHPESPAILAGLKVEQEKRGDETDPWRDKLHDLAEANGQVEWRLSDLIGRLGVAIDKQTKATSMRVAIVLKELGWEKRRTSAGNVWVAPENEITERSVFEGYS